MFFDTCLYLCFILQYSILYMTCTNCIYFVVWSLFNESLQYTNNCACLLTWCASLPISIRPVSAKKKKQEIPLLPLARSLSPSFPSILADILYLMLAQTLVT